MKEYYKGNIVNVNNLSPVAYQFDIVCQKATSFTRILYEYLNELNSGELDQEKKDKLSKLISEIVKPKIKDTHKFSIIYTKIYDEDGNEYGKELISNCVFPIGNNHVSFDIDSSKGHHNELYLDKSSNIVYSVTNPYIDYYYVIGDKCEEETFMPMPIVDKLLRYGIHREKSQSTNNKENDLVCILPDSFKIDLQPKMSFPEDKKINYAISEESKASEIEVQNYLDKFRKGFGKRKRERDYYGVIKNMHMCNDLGSYFFDEDKEKATSITKKI